MCVCAPTRGLHWQHPFEPVCTGMKSLITFCNFLHASFCEWNTAQNGEDDLQMSVTTTWPDL